MFTNVEQTLMLKIKALNTKMASFIAGHQIDDKPLFFRRGLFFLAAEGCDRDIF